MGGNPAGALPTSPAVLLSSRELLVLLLLARRYSREQVADLLGGEATVAEMLTSAVHALGARDVAEAIAIARERGLIH